MAFQPSSVTLSAQPLPRSTQARVTSMLPETARRDHSGHALRITSSWSCVRGARPSSVARTSTTAWRVKASTSASS